MKEHFDETRLLREFKVGDFVQLKNVLKGSKFDADYEGATLTIVRKTKGGSYIVKDQSGFELTKRFPPNQLKPIKSHNQEPGAMFEVKTIIDHKEVAGGHEYLIEWTHTNERTWEPESNVFAETKLKQYWRRLLELKRGDVATDVQVGTTYTP